MSCGATIVTFLLFAGIVPGSRNWRHVIDEIHEIRSPSSVSGFMLSLTTRLPAGNFRHELNSFSPGGSAVPVTTGVVVDGGVGVGVAVGAVPAVVGTGGGTRRPNFRAAWIMGAMGAGAGVGVTPIFVVVPSAPTTTAAYPTEGRSPYSGSASASTSASARLTGWRTPGLPCRFLVIGCCIPS